MSVILYPMGGYQRLARNSGLLNAVFQDLGCKQGLEITDLAEFLFGLNVAAFEKIYYRHATIQDEIQEMRECMEVGWEYDVNDWNDPSELYPVLKRICYQCNEFEDSHKLAKRVKLIQDALEICDAMCGGKYARSENN